MNQYDTDGLRNYTTFRIVCTKHNRAVVGPLRIASDIYTVTDEKTIDMNIYSVVPVFAEPEEGSDGSYVLRGQLYCGGVQTLLESLENSLNGVSPHEDCSEHWQFLFDVKVKEGQ